MRSPKFVFSEKVITASVGRTAMVAAWKKKVRPQLRKQVLWDLIEFRDIDENINEIAETISCDVRNGSYRVNRPQTYLVEKSKGLCRQMTLAHPVDMILLQCLSSRLYKQILDGAPSKSAFFEPGDMKWSTGKMTIGEGEYGSIASWKRFQKRVLKFSKENRFIVVTDVANFYDFINFSHLRNIISSICTNVEEALLDLLVYLLNELAWVPDYMPRQEMGMPQMEAEAPRILANAMLFELDRVVESKSLLNYARFMDDIDFGADTVSDAKVLIRDIDLTLQSRQLRLNSSKTKILTQQDAFKHFCVAENSNLDRYSALIEATGSWPKLKSKIGQSILRRYEKWLDRQPKGVPNSSSVFLHGNGSKIHKRTFTLLKKCEIEAPLDDYMWLIKNSPGMRGTAFRQLVHTRRPNQAMQSIFKILESGTFVDDYAFIELANFCVHAKFRDTAKLRGLIEATLGYLSGNGKVASYSSIVRRRYWITRGRHSLSGNQITG
jgi:Reverse transcriptase (RNA-dependent DNA polymerase)